MTIFKQICRQVADFELWVRMLSVAFGIQVIKPSKTIPYCVTYSVTPIVLFVANSIFKQLDGKESI